MAKNDSVTPVKTFTRIHLTPSTKECLCVLHGEHIQRSDYRLKLFHKDIKTSHCFLIEKILNLSISKDESTNHVCRACVRKLVVLENKINSLKDQFESTRRKLETSHGKRARKRQQTNTESSSKKSLFSGVQTEDNRFTNSQDSNSPITGLCQQLESTFPSSLFPFQDSNLLVHGQQYQINSRLIDALTSNDHVTAGKELMRNPDIKKQILVEMIAETKENLKKMCKKDNLSILRSQKNVPFENFSLLSVAEEIRAKLPMMWEYLEGCISNPKQELVNKLKKGDALLPQLVSGISTLVHLYNRDMNSFQMMNSLILMKSGCKKAAFGRLSAIVTCQSYGATLSAVDGISENWATPLLKWKSEVENASSIEDAIEKQIDSLDETIDMLSESPKLTEILVLEQEQLKESLKQHRASMHPGYYFIGDNVDLRTQVRQMTSKHQPKDFHMYNLCSYLNRVSGNHLDNTLPKRDINTIPFNEFLPSQEQHQKLLRDFAFLVAHEWCSRITWLRPFKTVLQQHIQHEHMKEMTKKAERVNMGVLRKNEQYNDQMVDICQFLRKFVPKHDDNEEQSLLKPVKVLSGGDYLTFEQHKSAQSSMANGWTPSSRLEGLVPKMEEFHNQAELLKVIWKTLYSTKSSKDTGTLYAARNTINAKNVTNEPSDNFYASTELLNKFDSAYISAGGLHHFGMVSLESEPVKNKYTGELGNKESMAEFVLSEAQSFLLEYLDIELPRIPEYGPQNNVLMCRYCHKLYKKTKALRKHEFSVHGLFDPLFSSVEKGEQATETSSSDGILNYTKQCLLLGLLRLNHNYAIRMGDGQRIMDVNMYLCLLYKINNCTKYAYGMLETIAQTKALLTERLAYQLIWNRTVNHQGKIDTNHPNDLDIEHQNKLFKNQVHSYRGEFTDKTISRVSRSVVTTDKVMKAFDHSMKVFRPSGKHQSINTEDDIWQLIQQLTERKVFNYTPGRCHNHFGFINSNLFEIDNEKLREWISNCLRRYAQEHFY